MPAAELTCEDEDDDDGPFDTFTEADVDADIEFDGDVTAAARIMSEVSSITTSIIAAFRLPLEPRFNEVEPGSPDDDDADTDADDADE